MSLFQVELQTQIAQQATEIETLTDEIKVLKSEVEGLSSQVQTEREKSRNLEDLLHEQDRRDNISSRGATRR